MRLRHSVSEETSESGDCSSSSQGDKEHDDSESPDDDDDDEEDDAVGHENVHGRGGGSDNGYSEDVNEENDSDDDETSEDDEPEAPNEDGMNSREALVSYSAPGVHEEKMNHDATVEEEDGTQNNGEVLSTVNESAQQHEPPRDDMQP